MTIFSSYACTGQAAVLCICLDSHALGHTCLVPNKDNITPVSKLVEQILRNRRKFMRETFFNSVDEETEGCTVLFVY